VVAHTYVPQSKTFEMVEEKKICTKKWEKIDDKEAFVVSLPY